MFNLKIHLKFKPKVKVNKMFQSNVMYTPFELLKNIIFAIKNNALKKSFYFFIFCKKSLKFWKNILIESAFILNFIIAMLQNK